MNIVQPPLKLVYYPHPSLRHKAQPLGAISRFTRRVGEELKRLMYEHKGLGLAAPQIGVPIRMFALNYEGDPEKREAEGVYINPVILDKRGTMEGEEGCLSFPQLYLKVRRARTVRVEAYNMEGQRVELEVSDLPARIWQHEADHLDATLFVDKLGVIGQLAAKAPLREFERLHKKAQRKGELPSDEDIEKMLRELENAEFLAGTRNPWSEPAESAPARPVTGAVPPNLEHRATGDS